ncbi:MAG: TonB family protein [Chitinispirillia bacterium]|nr:TonB family protein [Chitinispirillia bacterium]MCL2267683.1 TonB family protein [Chitinispirillia bacterium]
MKPLSVKVFVILIAVLVIAAITNPDEKRHQRAAAAYLSQNFLMLSGNWPVGALSDIEKKELLSALDAAMLADDAALLDFVERRSFMFFSLTKMRAIGETIGAGAFGYVWLFADITDPKSAMGVIYSSYIEEGRRIIDRNQAGQYRWETGISMPDMAYIDSLISGAISIDSMPATGGDDCAGPGSGGEPAVLSPGPSILRGGRSRASIMSVGLGDMAVMRHLYSVRLRAKPCLNGAITVKIAINEAGAVTAARVLESTLKDPEFERTLLSRILGWTFEGGGAEGDITEITYPFVFSM